MTGQLDAVVDDPAEHPLQRVQLLQELLLIIRLLKHAVRCGVERALRVEEEEGGG